MDKCIAIYHVFIWMGTIFTEYVKTRCLLYPLCLFIIKSFNYNWNMALCFPTPGCFSKRSPFVWLNSFTNLLLCAHHFKYKVLHAWSASSCFLLPLFYHNIIQLSFVLTEHCDLPAQPSFKRAFSNNYFWHHDRKWQIEKEREEIQRIITYRPWLSKVVCEKVLKIPSFSRLAFFSGLTEIAGIRAGFLD